MVVKKKTKVKANEMAVIKEVKAIKKAKKSGNKAAVKKIQNW